LLQLLDYSVAQMLARAFPRTLQVEWADGLHQPSYTALEPRIQGQERTAELVSGRHVLGVIGLGPAEPVRELPGQSLQVLDSGVSDRSE
jgi:hypothetical protein